MQIQEEKTESIPQPAEPETAKGGKGFFAELLSWALHLAVAAAIVLLVYTFLLQPVRVDGRSMCNTLQDGELMLVTKPEYLLGDPAFGDVVTCRYPGRGNATFVKRVMGLPGDVIEIRDNIVIRNGEAVSEPYLTADLNNNGFDMEPFTLGDEEYFVMGDNRDHSHDSRNYYSNGTPAAITRNMILGHVRWIIFPLSGIRGVE